MQLVSNPRHLLYLLLFLLFGCSSLQVGTSQDFTWQGVSGVSLIRPSHDPWELTPVIKSELAAMGIESAVDMTDADLLATFTTEESPDLTSEGEIITRLQSLHIRFLDPVSRDAVAVLDYFYPLAGQIDPAAGVRELFAVVKQERPPADTARQAEAVSAPQQSPVKENQLHTQVMSEAATPADTGTPTSAEQQPEPQSSSPWRLRLQSWGFEDWGESDTVDY